MRLEKIQEILLYENQEKKLGKQEVVNLANVSISARQVRTKNYVLDLAMWNSSMNLPSTAVAEKGSIFLVGVLEVCLHMVKVRCLKCVATVPLSISFLTKVEPEVFSRKSPPAYHLLLD